MTFWTRIRLFKTSNLQTGFNGMFGTVTYTSIYLKYSLVTEDNNQFCTSTTKVFIFQNIFKLGDLQFRLSVQIPIKINSSVYNCAQDTVSTLDKVIVCMHKCFKTTPTMLKLEQNASGQFSYYSAAFITVSWQKVGLSTLQKMVPNTLTACPLISFESGTVIEQKVLAGFCRI